MNRISRLPEEKRRQILKDLPKTDIHLHLDGSLRIETMLELAETDGLELPGKTVSDLEKTLFKDYYQNLEEYLKSFSYSCSLLQNCENIERIAYELAIDNQREGVRYIEVRFAPQLLINPAQDFNAVMEAADSGLKRAKNEFNKNKREVSDPEFDYGLIVCAMRNFGPWSAYYDQFCKSFASTDPKRFISLGCEAVADMTLEALEKKDYRIVGFDIAGPENGFPAGRFASSFDKIKRNLLGITIHAGESYSVDSIYQAVMDGRADRIGHGFHLFVDTEESRHMQGPVTREKLADYMADRGICIEVCLTSNMQTMPDFSVPAKHKVKDMIDWGLPVTMCTDNRTVSKTSVTKEFELLLEAFDYDNQILKNVMMTGFRKAFYPGTHSQKTAYLEKVGMYFDKVLAEFQS